MANHQEHWDATRRMLWTAIQAKDMKLLPLSEQLGKNSAYLQQYFSRGTPKELDPDTLDTLCGILGITSPGTSKMAEPEPTKRDERLDVAMLQETDGQLIFNRQAVVQRVKRVPDFLSQPMAFAVYMPHDRLSPAIPVSSLLFVDHVQPPRREDRVFIEVANSGAYVGIYADDSLNKIVLTVDASGTKVDIPKTSIISLRKITYIKFP